MSITYDLVGLRRATLADTLPGGRVRDLILVAGGVGLLAVSARVAIPLPFNPVPVTGQTFAVLLLGSSYGLLRGLLTMLSYLAVGLAGAPVFSPSPTTGAPRTGMEMLHAPSAGYVVGMLLAVAVLGYLSQKAWDRNWSRAVPQMLIGNAAVYLVGLPWLAAATGFGLYQTLAIGLVPFLAGDTLKLMLAAGVLPLAWRLVGRDDPTPDSRT